MAAGLVAMAGLALAVGGCSKEEPVSVTPAGGSGAETAATEAARPTRPGGAIDPDLLERLPSLARVEEALDGPVVNLTELEKEKLRELREWLATNHPEITGRDAELIAQILMIIDRFMDSESMTLADLKSMGEYQLVQLWAMDADGDGVLSDEEAKRGFDSMTSLEGLMRERYADTLDADGDGMVSDEEMGGLEQRMEANMQPVMETMVQRAKLVSWDTNGDGVLSDDETAAGEAGLEAHDWDGDGEISEMERMSSYGEMLMDMNNALMLLEMPDMQQMGAEMQARAMENMERMNRPGPQMEDFDADGDGVYSDAEMEAFQTEQTVFQAERQALMQEMQREGEMMVARMFQAQFNAAVSALDSDGDGRLMSEEWSGSYDTLRGGRDARMFRYLYDADRSGSVTDAEVARFMDAYDSQSPYADADLNGVVDQTDLQYFVTQVSGQ